MIAKGFDERLLEIERVYLASRVREKVYIGVLFFLLGSLSTGLVSSFSSMRQLTLLQERQNNIMSRLNKVDGDIGDLRKSLSKFFLEYKAE